ncbi:MAG: formylglycine-generating enzyme family protein, partial [Chloroflexaceae bacterium]|nr:formylglycine-generating enzyme family protein [Chloroflexaceae bacterium]
PTPGASTPTPRLLNRPNPNPCSCPPTGTNPRYPVTVEEWREELAQRNEVFGRPVGYWCYVRPGTYRIGGWEKKKKGWGPSADITLPGFWVAKYPITVQQYREFMETGGYTNERYWTPNGWKWKEDEGRTQPDYWGDERFRGDDQPVIGVAWYEAAAFAVWLNTQLADALLSGSAIRLPTEAEWEVAAAYDAAGQRRTYPWGEAPEPTGTLADFDDGRKPDHPAPVSERPAGATACGAQEMVGSVWEWTSSSHKAYPEGSGILAKDFSSESWDTPVRGGSWWGDKTNVRCSSRSWNLPVNWYNNWGFRLFLSSNVRSDF